MKLSTFFYKKFELIEHGLLAVKGCEAGWT